MISLSFYGGLISSFFYSNLSTTMGKKKSWQRTRLYICTGLKWATRPAARSLVSRWPLLVRLFGNGRNITWPSIPWIATVQNLSLPVTIEIQTRAGRTNCSQLKPKSSSLAVTHQPQSTHHVWSAEKAIPTVKHEGWNIMFWDCFSDKATERPHHTEVTVDGATYLKMTMNQNIPRRQQRSG